MNYFIIDTRTNNLKDIKVNYAPCKYVDLLDRGLTKSEFFLYCVEIMDDLHAGENVVVSTTNHKGIRKLFETINIAELNNCFTMLSTEDDNVNYLSGTKVGSIIVKGDSDEN